MGIEELPNSLLQRYRDGAFKLVDGWGINEDLIDVFIHFNDFHIANGIEGTLCEIGVHHGRTLILLGLLKRSQERVVGIDLFEAAQDQNIDASGKGSNSAVSANLEKHAPGISFDLITANSFNLSEEQQNRISSVRIFHIDGGHFLEVVLNDLALAQRSLALGGIIVIDDYWHSGFPEVHEAVHRYFSGSNLIKAAPFMTGTNKLFLAHFSHRERLLDFVSSRLPANRKKPIRLLGYNAICTDPH